MTTERFLSFSCILSVLLFVLWIGGCGEPLVPDTIITDGNLQLSSIILTNLKQTTPATADPVCVGIGGSLKITWTAINPPSGAVIKLYLDINGNNVEITPSEGIPVSANQYVFLPQPGFAHTGVEATLVAQMSSGGLVFHTARSERKVRVGEGAVFVTSPATDVHIARGLPIVVRWDITNNLFLNHPDKALTIRLYVDTISEYRQGRSIEITPVVGIDAGLSTFEFNSGEIRTLALNTPYYFIARLFMDGVEQSQTASAATFTLAASLNVTSPQTEVRLNLHSVPVTWEMVGRSPAGLKVEILARLEGAGEDDPDRIISGEFAAEQGSGIADASKLPTGTYAIVARLFLRDARGAKIIQDTARATGTIVNAYEGYRGLYDLSDMAAVVDRNYSPIPGVIFEGYNINDQAGFEVAGVGDITGSGFSDFMIFTRHGQEYTVGNSGSAYLIHGQQTFPEIINLNSVASPQAQNRPVQGTILLFPLENLARKEPGTGNILGSYSVIGMPDVSGDGRGDILIGAPDAAPLTFYYRNYTTDPVTITDHYRQQRTIPGGYHGMEPAHVQPQFHITAPYGPVIREYRGWLATLYESAWDFPGEPIINDRYYLPGDTITVEIRPSPEGPRTYVFIEHERRKRGAAYLLTSDRLTAPEYVNSIYDLGKIGSPVEDGVSDDPSVMASGWVTFFHGGRTDRPQMLTWADEDVENYATTVSFMADITGNDYPEILISVPDADVQNMADLSDPPFEGQLGGASRRQGAGLVKILNGQMRRTSILTNVGTIGWDFGIWTYILPFNSFYQNTDGNNIYIDVLGAQAGSGLTGAAGLGRYEDTTAFGTEYVNGDFNGDSVPDFVVGAPGENHQAGTIYVVPVRPAIGRRAQVIDLADFNTNQTIDVEQNMRVPVLGTKISGTVPGERLGELVKSAGDFDGDGLADVMFSTPRANASGRIEAGRVYVLFGQPGTLGDFTIDQVGSQLGTQLPALIFEGQSSYDNFGERITTVYDVNGDGLDDILIAAPNASAPGKNQCGKVYLIYGKRNIVRTDPATGFKYVDYDGDGLPDEAWNVQDIGIRIPGAVFIGETAGSRLQAIAPAGDVNGNGIGDFLLGSPFTDVSSLQRQAGKAYLIYGKRYNVPDRMR